MYRMVSVAPPISCLYTQNESSDTGKRSFTVNYVQYQDIKLAEIAIYAQVFTKEEWQNIAS